MAPCRPSPGLTRCAAHSGPANGHAGRSSGLSVDLCPALASKPATTYARPRTATRDAVQSAAYAIPGGGSGPGWVNASSTTYYRPDGRYYGRAKRGKHMTEAAANAPEGHAGRGRACS